MSNIATKGISQQQGNFIKFGEDKKEVPTLNVKDTDFLLKLMLENSFKGTQLEQAYECMKKLATIHKSFLGVPDEG
jgi:hypothetical protein|tara:strand:- start:370 stop:597 length:228 start_codon:yes stop_codon:yes gene_type:complete